MNRKRPILLKQIFAGFFLALFLCIHVGKLTHHHGLISPAQKGFVKANKVSGSGDCSICSFHVAKDAHHYNDFVLAKENTALSSGYASYSALFTTSAGAPSSGRGPPFHS